MTPQDALSLAQRVHPHDLVARLAYMQGQWNRCDADDMPAWEEAIRLTRDGRRRSQLNRESFLYGTQGVN